MKVSWQEGAGQMGKRAQRFSEGKASPWPVAAAAAALVALLHLVFMGFSGVGFGWHSPYNSYVLQAQAWLSGRLDLGQDYPYLELAVYQGRYYVSFPPFPSYVLLPFVALFGEAVPEVALALGAASLGAGCAALLGARFGLDPRAQVALAAFLYGGTALWQVTVEGSVWFFAQNLSLLCTLLALCQASRGRLGWGLFFLSCAVGCRPFQLCFLPLVALLAREAWEGPGKSWLRGVLRRPWALLPGFLMGCSYMALNALRFGNPLEFGHNYLPEFVRSPQGQFSLSYLLGNLESLWRLPTLDPETGTLQFPLFNGMNVFLAFPLLVWLLYRMARAGRGWLEASSWRRVLAVGWGCLLLELFLLLCHKTMGGHHFGNRYVGDLMPGAYLMLCALPRGKPLSGGEEGLFLFLLLGGALVNFTGVLGYFQPG